ncbi:MAG: hypothetical protein KAR47_12520 [Planctomycetes bacterium]|nr:hypothetical protein [Planctomycetota bacterium]
MTHRQIERHRRHLVEILQREKSPQRTEALYALAKEVGASTGKKRDGEGDIDAVGLVENIHYALQTASMTDMCRTAAKNYWIAFVASLVALVSAAAAWMAVYVNIIAKLKGLYP